MTVTAEILDGIFVLWRQPDTLALWGIPHPMREGQSPRDLWEYHRSPVPSEVWHGRYTYTPGPGDRWVWLGSPGWWGTRTAVEQALISAWLVKLREQDLVPRGPGEWVTLK